MGLWGELWAGLRGRSKLESLVVGPGSGEEKVWEPKREKMR